VTGKSATPAIVPQTMITIQQKKNFNRCAVAVEIYFMFYVARAYTLASTVGAGGMQL